MLGGCRLPLDPGGDHVVFRRLVGIDVVAVGDKKLYRHFKFFAGLRLDLVGNVNLHQLALRSRRSQQKKQQNSDHSSRLRMSFSMTSRPTRPVWVRWILPWRSIMNDVGRP